MCLLLSDHVITADTTSRAGSVEITIAADEFSVSLSPLAAGILSELGGLSKEALANLVDVRVVSQGHVSDTPVFGDIELHDEGIIFKPRYAFVPGLSYQIQLRGSDPSRWQFSLPGKPGQAVTRLHQIFPSMDSLPENLLKMYLHFSKPMSRGLVYRYIHLLDESGKEVQLAFLELEEGLWNPDGTRFTLLFDPGRIKRGLTPRMEVGLPLQAGRRYTLLVDSAWRDADGLPLVASARKSFSVRSADTLQPDVKKWILTAPRIDSIEPLIVVLDEPLDEALLRSAIAVETEDGVYIDGEVTVARNETVWSFQPDHPWAHDNYSLVIKAYLEDLAANSIGKPFEGRSGEPYPNSSEDVRLKFRAVK